MTDPTDSGVCPVIDATGRRPLEHSCCRKLAELESAHAAARDEWQVKLIEAETQARKLAKALEVCLDALEDVELLGLAEVSDARALARKALEE